MTPLGNAPCSDNDGVGKPVVATVNDADEPVVNVTLLELVIAGA